MEIKIGRVKWILGGLATLWDPRRVYYVSEIEKR